MGSACSNDGSLVESVGAEHDAAKKEQKKEPEVTFAAIMLILSIVLIMGLETISLAQCFGFLPDYFLEKGLDQSWVGITGGAQFLCVFLTTVLSSKLAQAPGWGVSKILPRAICGQIITQIVWGIVGSQLSGISLGIFTLFARSMTGFWDGFVQMSAPAMILRILPESQIGNAMGGVEALRAIGSLLAPIFGTQLYTIGGGQVFWAPFVCGAALEVVALAIYFFALSRTPTGQTDQTGKSVSAMALIGKAPTIALMLALIMALFPISAVEPALEPYLTAPPFNCTVDQVGFFFILMGVSDIVSACLGPPLVGLLGHIPAMYVASVIQIGGCLLIAFMKQNFWVLYASFLPASFGLMPVFIASSAVLMRICRTYDLDPKAYTEFISAAIMGSMTLGMGLFNVLSGVLVQDMGFRHFNLVGAGVTGLQIPIIAIGFSRWAMGRPLAPPMEETEEYKAEAAAKKEKEAEKKRLAQEEKARSNAEKAEAAQIKVA